MYIVTRDTTSFAAPVMANTTTQTGTKPNPLTHHTLVIVISILLALSFPAICLWHYYISPRRHRRKAPKEVLSLPNRCNHSFRTVQISAPLPCNTECPPLGSHGHVPKQTQRTQWEQQPPRDSRRDRLFQHVDPVQDRYAIELSKVNAKSSTGEPLSTNPKAEHGAVGTARADVGCHRNFSDFGRLPTLPNPDEFAAVEQDIVDSVRQPKSSTATRKGIRHVGALRSVLVKYNSFQAESNAAELDFVSPSEGRSEVGRVQDVGASRTLEMRRNSFQAESNAAELDFASSSEGRSEAGPVQDVGASRTMEMRSNNFQRASHVAVIEEAPRNSVLSQVEMDFGQVLRPSSAKPVLRLSIPTAKELGLRDAIPVVNPRDVRDVRDLREQDKQLGLRGAAPVVAKEVKDLRRQSKRQSLR